MSVNRRGFLGAILAAAAAPAIIRSGVLMPVRELLLPPDPQETLRELGTASLIAPGLRLGDIITISGMVGAGGALKQYVVSEVTGSAVLRIAPREAEERRLGWKPRRISAS